MSKLNMLVALVASICISCGDGADFTTTETTQAAKGGKPGGGGDDPVCPEGQTPRKGSCVYKSAHCSDGIDNDSDGLVDCADSDCAISCQNETETGPEECSDGLDNDNDGLVDCDDNSGCTAEPICIGSEYHNILTGPDTCLDGIDNDQDGLTDCEDPDCPDYHYPPFNPELPVVPVCA